MVGENCGAQRLEEADAMVYQNEVSKNDARNQLTEHGGLFYSLKKLGAQFGSNQDDN